MKRNLIEISLEDVKEVVNAADPEDLLKMDCPKDEYDPESRMIHELINAHHPQSPIETANIVAFVWFFYFGDMTKPIQFHPSAFEIGRNLFAKFQTTTISALGAGDAQGEGRK